MCYCGLAETCDDIADDMHVVSLLQSHMSIDTSVGSQIEPMMPIRETNSSSPVQVIDQKITIVGLNESKLKSSLKLSRLDHDITMMVSLIGDELAKLNGKAASHNTEATPGKEPTQISEIHNYKSVVASVCFVACLVYVLLKQHAHDLAFGFAASVAYVLTSSSLISLNKYIMQESVFPYAMALTTLHMASAWFGLFALYCMKPQMFPQMELAPKGAQVFGVACALPQYFIPLGCFFGLSLFGANAAYHYCSVAFLQFMKETNVVWVFCCCVAAGSQQFSRAKVFTLTWIVAGAGLAISGEINFMLIGFVFQLLSQAGEVGKNVLGEWMMTTSNLKLDALTYTLSLAPMTFVPLGLGTACTYNPQMLHDLVDHFPLLAFSASMAVVLNVWISVVIKHCSVMVFILVGMVKDIFIVILATITFGDPISSQQIIGFIICLSGIAAYSSIKLIPHWWEWLSPCESKRPSGCDGCVFVPSVSRKSSISNSGL
jgi:hypothetical protein